MIPSLMPNSRSVHSSPQLFAVAKANEPIGFTIVEVTIALAIFSIAVVMLTQSFVNTLLSLDSIESEASILSDVRFVRAQALIVADREEFEEGGEVITLSSGSAIWYATIESTTVSDLFNVLLIIEMESPDNGEIEVYEQELFLLRPTWSDPVERSELIAENRDRLHSNRLAFDWQ